MTPDDVAISGRLVDLEGRPLAGVRIEPGTLAAPKGDDLSAWLEAVKLGEPPWTAVKHLRDSGLPFEASGIGGELVTDADGRFRLTGIGRERIVPLVFSGPTIARTEAKGVTRQMAPISQAKTNSKPGSTTIPVVGAEFELALSPTKVIEGVVRDAATGEPLPGVSLQSWRFANDSFVSERHIRTRSDAQGRFRLVGMPKGAGNQIIAVPGDDQPYFMREVKVPDAPGLEPVAVDFALHRGIWITGRVTDQATKQPIPLAQLFYMPFLTNNHAQALPEFDASGNVDGYQQRYKTDADGSYRLVGLPGRAIVGVLALDDPYYQGQGAADIAGLDERGHFPTYRNPLPPSTKWPTAMKEIDPTEGTGAVELDFAIEPGKQVEMAMVDPAGQPIAGVKATGASPRRYQGAAEKADLVVTALGPDEERTLLLHEEERKLGKVVRVRASDAPQKRTVQLEPCATIRGRLVDQGQAPVRGVEIRIDVLPSGDFSKDLPKVTTDAEGRFEHTGVLPGADYAVNAIGDSFGFRTVAKDLSVEPGEMIDLGTVDVTSKDRPKPVRIKAAVAAASGDKNSKEPAPGANRTERNPLPTFAGKVVDPTGKPVEGAELYLVFHVPQPTGLLIPAWKPLASSDKNGAFRFTVRRADFGMRIIAGELGHAALVAVKEGFGFAWSGAGQFETTRTPAALQQKLKRMLAGSGGPLKLVVDDQPIRGRIVDINGQGVAGARVTLTEVWSTMNDDLTAWRKAAMQPNADYYSARMATPRVINGPQVRSLVKPAVTDDDGRFVLSGAGRGRIVELIVEGPGIETAKILARTEAGDKIELASEHRRSDLGTYIYHPAELVHVAGPSEPISGVVIDAQTKAPLPGVTIKSQKRQGQAIHGWGQDFVRAVTDEQGHYRLTGMPVGENRIAAIAPEGDTPYLSMSKNANTTSPDRSLEVDFDLRTGVWIEGRITDKKTGKGLPGLVEYYVRNESPNWEFARTLNVDERDRLRADDEGHYRIAVLPGPGILAFMADEHQKYPRASTILKLDGSREKAGTSLLRTRPSLFYPQNAHVVAEVDPAADAKRLTLDLELDAGSSLVGRVVDPEGQRLTGFHYSGQFEQFDTWMQSSDGTFELKDYDPNSPRHVYFAHRQRNLAGSVIVEGQQPPNFVVKLQRAGSAKGRLVDEDGSPLASYELVAWSPPRATPASPAQEFPRVPLPPNLVNRASGRYETDRDGRFEISCLTPGAEYRLRL